MHPAYTKKQNKQKLTQIILLLSAIMICDDGEDIISACRSVSGFDQQLALKYWERANKLPEIMVNESRKRNV